MRMMKLALIALAATIAWSVTAEALEVKKRREAPGTPADVWAMVGEFCAIKDWHPAVADCVEETEGDVVFRTLTLKDGGKIKEKLTEKERHELQLRDARHPAPGQELQSEPSESARTTSENRVEIVWQATFDAEGASDDDAKKNITGILDDGVDGIKGKANGSPLRRRRQG